MSVEATNNNSQTQPLFNTENVPTTEQIAKFGSFASTPVTKEAPQGLPPQTTGSASSANPTTDPNTAHPQLSAKTFERAAVIKDQINNHQLTLTPGLSKFIHEVATALKQLSPEQKESLRKDTNAYQVEHPRSEFDHGPSAAPKPNTKPSPSDAPTGQVG